MTDLSNLTNLLNLILLYLMYLVVSFWLFNGNFLSPSFVFSTAMSLTLCLAYYAAVNMEMLFAINFRTFWIFGFAGFIFLATEFFVYAMHTVKVLDRGSCLDSSLNLNIKHQPLLIDKQIQWAFTAILALSFLLALIVLYLNTGGGSFSQRMNEYKVLVLHDTGRLRGRFIVSQIYKINFAGINLFGYVMVYNLVLCNAKIREVLSYIIDAVLYALFSSVYNGARQSAIEVLLFLITVYMALNMKPGGRQKIYFFIIKMIPVLVLVMCLFTAAGDLVGRNLGKKSALQNLIEYACGGIYAFNFHIDEGASTKFFGEMSFAYAYSAFQKLGLMPYGGPTTAVQFDLYGNTLTIFGKWYRDFGAVGVFIMTFLVSLSYSSVFYGKIIHSGNLTKEHHITRIFYCQFMMALILAGYDDRISAMMTMQTVTFLIFVVILYKLLIVDKLKIF